MKVEKFREKNKKDLRKINPRERLKGVEIVWLAKMREVKKSLN